MNEVRRGGGMMRIKRHSGGQVKNNGQPRNGDDQKYRTIPDECPCPRCNLVGAARAGKD